VRFRAAFSAALLLPADSKFFFSEFSNDIFSPLPHHIYSEDYFSKHCIFVRNPGKDFKEKIADLDVPCIAKVLFFETD